MKENLPRVKSVRAAPDSYALDIAWVDDRQSRVDLTGLVQSTRHFRVFTDNPAAFRDARVIGYGTGVGWANGLDCSAAMLRRLAGSSPS